MLNQKLHLRVKQTLIEKTNADQVHFRAPAPQDAAADRLTLGTLDTGHHEVTDAIVVRAVRNALS